MGFCVSKLKVLKKLVGIAIQGHDKMMNVGRINLRYWILVICVLPIVLSAEGTVSWSSVSKKITAPAREFIAASLEVAEVGQGVRLGKHTGSFSGARIGPYEFQATSKINSAVFKLVIETDVSFLDESGKPIEMVNAPEGAEILETFIGFTLTSPRNNPQAVQAVRDVYNEVHNQSLQETHFNLEENASIRVDRSKGAVRRINVEFASDHGGSTIETYYDAEGRPRFILVMQSHWRFISQDQTLDKGVEYRLYFNEKGESIESLKRSFEGLDDQTFKASKAAAENIRFIMPGLDKRIYQRAVELRGVKNAEEANKLGSLYMSEVNNLNSLMMF